MNPELLKKAERIINICTMHTVGESGFSADWVMSLIDEDGYPTSSMMTASRADGFNWIAFCTGIGAGFNKAARIERNPRSSIYMFKQESFTGISLVGKIEIMTDKETKQKMWYDALGDSFSSPEDERLCVLMFRPE